MQDDLGDRMKMYEMAEAGRKCMPLLPIAARIDGRSFSKFTSGLERPYDRRLSELMIDTVKFLVRETNAVCGYTQSDEITLAWYTPTFDSQIIFDGRISKLVSVLASLTTAHFNRRLPQFLPAEYAEKLPHFDARVWNLPSLEEAANTFLWRELDAIKNSISMAARAHYSHKQLDSKNGGEMQEMLLQKGVNWHDYPDFFKRGTYIQRRKTVRKFDTDELEKLPPMHEARKNPELMIERTDYVPLALPPLNRVKNRVAVLFEGAAPETAETA
ncbi:tRNA(His) guanylyltransferase Thg1 family protein [Nannocystis radixulma]|uniref:tRNA(His) guanylyltransferase Thg1 family protein n=1 Tax=Nannocystis radixulma TaxID=2995305 RepID=A0ABT5B4L7_9BACT|nr:tRNA(His) guanylyltransferase Thg1 family protein [Nannocystis radixulma]MDC0669065.1 tRNA(His) guanylyltransferase Thg1 family protein [Nannocystis radixulma]